jgi:hypothetical protein
MFLRVSACMLALCPLLGSAAPSSCCHGSRAAGQHFLSHEDGFPASAALEKGYNRRATLLVYLNDVPQVGWHQVKVSCKALAVCQLAVWHANFAVHASQSKCLPLTCTKNRHARFIVM